MFSGIYRFAEQNIGITSVFDEIHQMCAAYQTTEQPVFSVQTDEADIAKEREKSASEREKEKLSPYEFPAPYLETLAVYRKIADRLTDYDTILFHGSVIAVDGEGFLFTAKSGTGKSTHTRLWRELFGERAVMVNDDKPLLRIKEQGVFAYGTPWDGKHHLSTNISVPLKGICILERAAENSILPLEKTQAFPMLIQQAHRPADSQALRKTLAWIDKIGSMVPLYRLGCNMEQTAAQVAYNGMKEGIK